MSDEIRIRPARALDIATLVDFNIGMARETEGKELSRQIVTAGVTSLLNRPADGFYVVAENDPAVLGALMVTFEWSDWRSGFFWWIQSVFVRPEFRRRGVFKRLYRHVRTLAKDRPDVCGLRLYVEGDNESARQTYESLGMRMTPYRMYEEEF